MSTDSIYVCHIYWRIYSALNPLKCMLVNKNLYTICIYIQGKYIRNGKWKWKDSHTQRPRRLDLYNIYSSFPLWFIFLYNSLRHAKRPEEKSLITKQQNTFKPLAATFAQPTPADWHQTRDVVSGSQTRFSITFTLLDVHTYKHIMYVQVPWCA